MANGRGVFSSIKSRLGMSGDDHAQVDDYEAYEDYDEEYDEVYDDYADDYAEDYVDD